MWFPQANAGQKTSYVEPRLSNKNTHYQEATQSKQHLKRINVQKTYKHISVEGRDNSRNATDVSTNAMFPSRVNKIVLLEQRF